MPNLWDHLPNAKYIDAVIASVKAYPNEWGAAWIVAWDATWDATWDAARNASRAASRDADKGPAWSAAWNATWDAARDSARHTAWDAIRALIAWDDCAYMLESEPGELAILAAFGDQRAVLLLPACTALAAIKEKETICQ